MHNLLQGLITRYHLKLRLQALSAIGTCQIQSLVTVCHTKPSFQERH